MSENLQNQPLTSIPVRFSDGLQNQMSRLQRAAEQSHDPRPILTVLLLREAIKVFFLRLQDISVSLSDVSVLKSERIEIHRGKPVVYIYYMLKNDFLFIEGVDFFPWDGGPPIDPGSKMHVLFCSTRGILYSWTAIICPEDDGDDEQVAVATGLSAQIEIFVMGLASLLAAMCYQSRFEAVILHGLPSQEHVAPIILFAQSLLVGEPFNYAKVVVGLTMRFEPQSGNAANTIPTREEFAKHSDNVTMLEKLDMARMSPYGVENLPGTLASYTPTSPGLERLSLKALDPLFSPRRQVWFALSFGSNQAVCSEPRPLLVQDAQGAQGQLTTTWPRYATRWVFAGYANTLQVMADLDQALNQEMRFMVILPSMILLLLKNKDLQMRITHAVKDSKVNVEMHFQCEARLVTKLYAKSGFMGASAIRIPKTITMSTDMIWGDLGSHAMLLNNTIASRRAPFYNVANLINGGQGSDTFDGGYTTGKGNSRHSAEGDAGIAVVAGQSQRVDDSAVLIADGAVLVAQNFGHDVSDPLGSGQCGRDTQVGIGTQLGGDGNNAPSGIGMLLGDGSRMAKTSRLCAVEGDCGQQEPRDLNKLHRPTRFLISGTERLSTDESFSAHGKHRDENRLKVYGECEARWADVLGMSTLPTHAETCMLAALGTQHRSLSVIH